MRHFAIYHQPSGVVIAVHSSNAALRQASDLFANTTAVEHEGQSYPMAELEVLRVPLEEMAAIADDPGTYESWAMNGVHAAHRQGALRVEVVRGRPGLRRTTPEEQDLVEQGRAERQGKVRLREIAREIAEIREAIQAGAAPRLYAEERARLIAEREAIHQRLGSGT